MKSIKTISFWHILMFAVCALFVTSCDLTLVEEVENAVEDNVDEGKDGQEEYLNGTVIYEDPDFCIRQYGEIVYNDSTRLVSVELTEQCLKELTPTTMVFEGLPKDSIPQVGHVLVSLFSDAAPDGYIRKVLAVKKEGNRVVLTTRDASISEVFDEFAVDFGKSALPPEVEEEFVEIRSRGGNPWEETSFRNESTRAIVMEHQMSRAPYVSAGKSSESFRLSRSSTFDDFDDNMDVEDEMDDSDKPKDPNDPSMVEVTRFPLVDIDEKNIMTKYGFQPNLRYKEGYVIYGKFKDTNDFAFKVGYYQDIHFQLPFTGTCELSAPDLTDWYPECPRIFDKLKDGVPVAKFAICGLPFTVKVGMSFLGYSASGSINGTFNYKVKETTYMGIEVKEDENGETAIKQINYKVEEHKGSPIYFDNFSFTGTIGITLVSGNVSLCAGNGGTIDLVLTVGVPIEAGFEVKPSLQNPFKLTYGLFLNVDLALEFLKKFEPLSGKVSVTLFKLPLMQLDIAFHANFGDESNTSLIDVGTNHAEIEFKVEPAPAATVTGTIGTLSNDLFSSYLMSVGILYCELDKYSDFYLENPTFMKVGATNFDLVNEEIVTGLQTEKEYQNKQSEWRHRLVDLKPYTTYIYRPYIKVLSIGNEAYVYGEIETFRTRDASDRGEYSEDAYVDMGEDVTAKWCSSNIGAIYPQYAGKYFGWSEVNDDEHTQWMWPEQKDSFDPDSYDIGLYSIGIYSKFSENAECLDPVSVHYGSSYRTPTVDDWKNLLDNCTVEPDMYEGVKGIKVTGKNGNAIFFPAGGFRAGDSVEEKDDYAAFWTSDAPSIDGNDMYDAYCVVFNANSFNFDEEDLYKCVLQPRCAGMNIRPVRDK